ncbi:hypothetical protein GCM10011505_09500 [Tistrella bauzanensis]|uniref:Uncharacterized protein n=1 Tax=Tistrella bauzanensis TaxID=657419 RepID=A0ABQ1I9Y3_9PROT|nr:hypothetical protein GCM10011505_09500 [Tistrella bauzanensis]
MIGTDIIGIRIGFGQQRHKGQLHLAIIRRHPVTEIDQPRIKPRHSTFDDRFKTGQSYVLPAARVLKQRCQDNMEPIGKGSPTYRPGNMAPAMTSLLHIRTAALMIGG